MMSSKSEIQLHSENLKLVLWSTKHSSISIACSELCFCDVLRTWVSSHLSISSRESYISSSCLISFSVLTCLCWCISYIMMRLLWRFDLIFVFMFFHNRQFFSEAWWFYVVNFRYDDFFWMITYNRYVRL